MDNFEKPLEKNSKSLGKRHWLSQTIPPLLMFSVFLVTNDGTALVFISWFLMLPVLFSVISIFAKFIRYKKRKYFMLRPFLTVFNFLLIMGVALWTYETALEQATQAAEILHETCNENFTCPENPIDWIVDGNRISRSDLGVWFKYTALYYYQPESFDIRVYQGPDAGHNITGGVGKSVQVYPYSED